MAPNTQIGHDSHKECEAEFKEMWFLADLRGCKLQRPPLSVRLKSEGTEKFLGHPEEKASRRRSSALFPGQGLAQAAAQLREPLRDGRLPPARGVDRPLDDSGDRALRASRAQERIHLVREQFTEQERSLVDVQLQDAKVLPLRRRAM